MFVGLQETLLNKLNFNYIYTKQDDYIPKDETAEEEIEEEQFTLD